MQTFLLKCSVACVLAASVRHALAEDCNWTSPPLGVDRVAEFRLWIPEGVAVLRAVIVLVPGANLDGRAMAADADWQRLAREQKAALLACSMRGQQGNWYYEAEHWSGGVLLRALDELGRRTAHEELSTVRLAMWGHSAGGQFNFNFACWRPGRVLAFVANKGAYYTDQPSAAVRALPGLWSAGQNDSDVRLGNITSLFAEGRRQGAPWCLAIEPNTAHEVGRTKEFGNRFLEAVLRSIPADGKSRADDPTAGDWSGDLTTHEIRPESESPRALDGKVHLNAWLPNEPTARAWQAFVKEGR